MLESTISNLLQKVLGDFLDINDLSFGIMKGEIKLNDIELKSHVLAPLRLKAGSVKHFEVMLGNPIRIILEELKMSVTDEFTIKEMSPEDLKNQKKEALKTHEVMQKPQEPGYLSSMMFNVVDSIHVDINKIFIEFVSKNTKLIIVMNRLAIVNTKSDSTNKKLLALDGLAIKMCVGEEEVMILEPVHASGTLGIAKDYSLDISLPNIDLKLPQKFYVEFMRIAQNLHMMFLKQSQPFIQERPKIPIRGNSRVWWYYAIKTIGNNVHKKYNEWNYATMKLFRERWRAYMKLWTLKTEELPYNTEQLGLLEDIMDQNTVMWIRDLVKIEVEEKRKKSPPQLGWFASLFTHGSVDSDKEHINEGKARSVDGPIAGAHGKKMQGIFNIVTFKLALLQDNNKFEIMCRHFKCTADFINNVLTAQLTLMDLSVIDQLIPDNAFPQMVTPFRKDIKIGQLCNLQESNDQLLDVHFQYNPKQETPSQLSINTKALLIVIQPQTIFHLKSYFELPQDVNNLVTDANIEEFKAYSKAGLQFAIESHRSLNIDFRLEAPCLVLPSLNTISKNSNKNINNIVMAINMGSLHIKSKLSQSQHKEFSNLNQAEMEEILPMMYDHYLVDLKGIKVTLDQQMSSLLQSENYLLEPSTLGVDFAKSIIAAKELTQYKCNVTLDKLHLMISPLKLNYLLHLAVVFQPESSNTSNDSSNSSNALPTSSLPNFNVVFNFDSFMCDLHEGFKFNRFTCIEMSQFHCVINNDSVLKVHPKLESFSVHINDNLLLKPSSDATMLVGQLELIEKQFKSEFMCEGIEFDIRYKDLHALLEYSQKIMKSLSTKDQLAIKKDENSKNESDTQKESPSSLSGTAEVSIKNVQFNFQDASPFSIKASGFKIQLLLQKQMELIVNLNKFNFFTPNLALIETPKDGLLHCSYTSTCIECTIGACHISIVPELTAAASVLLNLVKLQEVLPSTGDQNSSNEDSNKKDSEPTSLQFHLNNPTFTIQQFVIDLGQLAITSKEMSKFSIHMSGAYIKNEDTILFTDTNASMLYEKDIKLLFEPTTMTLNNKIYNNFMSLVDYIPAITSGLNATSATSSQDTSEEDALAIFIDCPFKVQLPGCLLSTTAKIHYKNEVTMSLVDTIATSQEQEFLSLSKCVLKYNTKLEADLQEMTLLLNIPVLMEMLSVVTGTQTSTSTSASQESTFEMDIHFKNFNCQLHPDCCFIFDELTMTMTQINIINLNIKYKQHLLLLNTSMNIQDFKRINSMGITANANMDECMAIKDILLHHYNTFNEYQQHQPQQPTQNQQSPPATYLIDLETIEFILNDQLHPLLQYTGALHTEVKVGSVLQCDALVKCHVVTFNPKLWAFEPFIEPSEFKITMNDNDILISNHHILNLTLSKSIYTTLFQSSTCQFTLENQLGTSCKVTSMLFKPNSIQCKHDSLINLEFTRYTPLISVQLNFELELNNTIHQIELRDVVINKDGQQILQATPHLSDVFYILVTISTINNKKHIKLHSPYQFTNKTCHTLYTNSLTINPNATVSIPLQLIHSKFKFKLMDKQSKHIIHFTDFLKGKTRVIQFDSLNLICHSECDLATIKKSKYPFMTITFISPLTIVNQLPLELGCQLTTSTSHKTQFITIPSGSKEFNSSMSVYDVQLDELFQLKLTNDLYQSSTMPLTIKDKHLLEFKGNDQFNCLLHCTVNEECGDVLTITLSSLFTLYNHLSIPLQLRSNLEHLTISPKQQAVFQSDDVTFTVNGHSKHVLLKDGVHGPLVFPQLHLGVSVEQQQVHIQARCVFFNATTMDLTLTDTINNKQYKVQANKELELMQSTQFKLNSELIELNQVCDHYIDLNESNHLLLLRQRLNGGQIHIHCTLIDYFPFCFKNNTTQPIALNGTMVVPKTTKGFTTKDKSFVLSTGTSTKEIEITMGCNEQMSINNQFYYIHSFQKEHSLMFEIGSVHAASPTSLKKDLLKPQYKVNLHLRSLGLSLLYNNEELIYVMMRGMHIQYLMTELSHFCQFKLKWLQIDNQCLDAAAPVMLFPTCQNDLFLHVQVLMSKEYSDVYYFNLLDIQLQPLSVELEESHLYKIMGFANELMAPANDQQLKEQQSNNDSMLLYFESLHINPLVIMASFEKSDTFQNKAMNILGSLLSIHDAELKLNALLINKLYGTMELIQNQFMEHYTQTLIKQVYKVIGGADILGNPIGLFSNISSGVQSAFYEPFVNNEDVLVGIAKGTETLVRKTLFGVSDSLTKVTSSVGTGLSRTLDQDYLKHRRITKNRNKPRHALDGITTGTKLLGSGLSSGITGLVNKPMEGASKNGIEGFMMGIGQGLVGVVSKPLVGIADMASSIGQGIKSTASDESIVDRIRYPRYITEPLQSYDVLKSEAFYVLRTTDTEKFKDNYIMHYIGKINTQMLIISDLHVMVTSRQIYKSIWVLNIENIGICYQNKEQLMVTDLDGRQYRFVTNNDKEALELAIEVQELVEGLKKQMKTQLKFK